MKIIDNRVQLEKEIPKGLTLRWYSSQLSKLQIIKENLLSELEKKEKYTGKAKKSRKKAKRFDELENELLFIKSLITR